VHLALQEDEKLETKSRGEGILKKVVIIPKK
jgi:predicted RNA-binding protein Jag